VFQLFCSISLFTLFYSGNCSPLLPVKLSGPHPQGLPTSTDIRPPPYNAYYYPPPRRRGGRRPPNPPLTPPTPTILTPTPVGGPGVPPPTTITPATPPPPPLTRGGQGARSTYLPAPIMLTIILQ
jgi:hypothetical protein